MISADNDEAATEQAEKMFEKILDGVRAELRDGDRLVIRVLNANVRGRILSWSNWGLSDAFFLQSDSPDDADARPTPRRTALLGRRGQSRRFFDSSVAGGFVCPGFLPQGVPDAILGKIMYVKLLVSFTYAIC